jgi:hypothetical protein
LVAAGLSDKKLTEIQAVYREQLENQVVEWSTQVAFVTLRKQE